MAGDIRPYPYGRVCTRMDERRIIHKRLSVCFFSEIFQYARTLGCPLLYLSSINIQTIGLFSEIQKVTGHTKGAAPL